MGGNSRGVLLFLVLCILGYSSGRPPIKSEGAEKGDPSSPKSPEGGNSSGMELGVEYSRYLQEVVQVLESDPDFRKKLEKADKSTIQDGSIAHELEFAGHHVRSQLDEIKQRELDRLRKASMRRYELANGIVRNPKIPEHLELRSHRFEIDDLKKLILTTSKDLEEADRKRREDFVRYEMEKKFEEESRLQHIKKEEDRLKEKSKLEEAKKRHKDHKKLNHPLTKDQLEEVWEERDHMRAEDWDPKTFFAMHDLNGDKVWDENELKVLFQKELDKAYDPKNTDDDLRERQEEMERMREHVMKESDKDGNRLISFDEFIAETKRDEFNKDPGWETIDEHERDLYSDDQYNKFVSQRQREIEEMMQRGEIPNGYPFFGEIPEGATPYEFVPGQPVHLPPMGHYPNQPDQFQGGVHPPQPYHPSQLNQQQPIQQQFQQQQIHPQFQQPQPGQEQFNRQQQIQFNQQPSNQHQFGNPPMNQQQQPGNPQMNQQQPGNPQMNQQPSNPPMNQQQPTHQQVNQQQPVPQQFNQPRQNNQQPPVQQQINQHQPEQQSGQQGHLNEQQPGQYQAQQPVAQQANLNPSDKMYQQPQPRGSPSLRSQALPSENVNQLKNQPQGQQQNQQLPNQAQVNRP